MLFYVCCAVVWDQGTEIILTLHEERLSYLLILPALRLRFLWMCPID